MDCPSVNTITARADCGAAPARPTARRVAAGRSVSALEGDRAAMASLSPQARLDLALELGARYREALGEAAQRFERVCRVVPLARR